MVYSHCEILWAENSGANLGRHPTENYAVGLDDAQNEAIIAHQRLRSKFLGLWIKNSLTIDAKRKFRDFNSTYIFNFQVDGSAMSFFILEMVRPGTHIGCSDIKYNL